jgi:alpha-galactosidase
VRYIQPSPRRIVVGGAYSWTPELVRDFAVTGGFRGARVHLMDIAPEPLKMAQTLCRKIIAAAKADIAVASTLDRHEALDGADIVLVSINTGGSDAHGLDVDIPLKYGIRSSVGDTAGPSGISRSLRNIPVVSDIAKSVREICPRAYLINVTNPMGTLTRAMRMQHERTVGYCHEVEWLRLRLAWRFGVPREQVRACTVGVNHMTWVAASMAGWMVLNGRASVPAFLSSALRCFWSTKYSLPWACLAGRQARDAQ